MKRRRRRKKWDLFIKRAIGRDFQMTSASVAHFPSIDCRCRVDRWRWRQRRQWLWRRSVSTWYRTSVQDPSSATKVVIWELCIFKMTCNANERSRRHRRIICFNDAKHTDTHTQNCGQLQIKHLIFIFIHEIMRRLLFYNKILQFHWQSISFKTIYACDRFAIRIYSNSMGVCARAQESYAWSVYWERCTGYGCR